jgi:hypothetical protein
MIEIKLKSSYLIYLKKPTKLIEERTDILINLYVIFTSLEKYNQLLTSNDFWSLDWTSSPMKLLKNTKWKSKNIS